MRKYAAIGTACAALAMAGCDGGKVVAPEKAPPALDSISPDSLDALSKKKIFFGHQSVGWNIIDGLKDIASEKGRAGFAFIESRTPGAAPGVYHASVGQNGDPLGKIKDFEAIMRGGMGGKVDIALMKFCYVDFEPGTDSEAIFRSYEETLGRLERDFPETVFVRVTAPHVAGDRGLKSFVKRVLGRPLSGREGNVARERLNGMIRSASAAQGKPLFDLALAESTAPDGTRLELSLGGAKYYRLVDAYTVDGGHLGEAGRKAAAAALLPALLEAAGRD